MSPTDEELLHAFYAGDNSALDLLFDRYEPNLAQMGRLILELRTGSTIQARGEWDIDERLSSVWIHVATTRSVHFGRWPYERVSALTWIIHLLCLEMDRHMGLRGPF